jgi:hypothetical protein
MKKLVTLLLISGSALIGKAQDAPQPELVKTMIGKTTCFASMPTGMTWSAPTKTADSSDVYSGSKDCGHGFTFGVILVQFSEPLFSSPDELEDEMIVYMEGLKKSWNVTKASGYGRGLIMTSDAKARGVIDYWTDKDGKEYAIKGWCNKTGYGIMYIKGPNIYPHATIQKNFFESFRFK